MSGCRANGRPGAVDQDHRRSVTNRRHLHQIQITDRQRNTPHVIEHQADSVVPKNSLPRWRGVRRGLEVSVAVG